MQEPEQNHHGQIGVLVVDDQEIFRKTMRDLVAGTEGLTLLGESSSGEEALEDAGRLSPGLVIMDVRMPGIGGVQAARHLTDRHEGLLVILVSVEPGDPSLLSESGAAVFLRKQELSPRVLREAIEAHASG